MSAEDYKTSAKTAEREIDRRRRNSTGFKAHCSECGKRGGVVLRYKVDARNFRLHWRLLCDKCGLKFRFVREQRGRLER